MKTLMSVTPTRHLGSQFPSPNVIFNFASLSRENRNLFRFSHRRWFCHPRTLSFCSSAASESVSYGGWDDPRLRGALGQPGDSTQLRNFLNSLGIDDKRYVFTYLLGFVCALAISRVRVSSIILFPACAIVFAVGFSIGIVNGGHVNELTLTGARKRSKDEALSVSTEKLRNLLDLFAGIDGKIGNLKSDISRRIESNRITRGDLESYVKVMESIGLSSLNARSVVEACVNSISIETQELERNINQKSGRRKKLGGENGFDLFQFIRGFFQESSVGSKPNKVKDCVKRDPTQVQVSDQSGGNIFASAVAEKSLSPVSSGNTGKGAPSSYGDIYNEPTMGWDGIKGLANGARRVNGFVQDDKMSFSNSESQDKRELDSKHYSHQTNRTWFMDNQQFSLKMDRHSEFAKRTSHSDLLESMDFSINLKHTETEASIKKEQILHKNNGSYRENSKREFYKPQERGERIFSEDNPCLADDLNGHKSDAGNSSSSTVSDDNIFNLYLVEAKSLLKEARECLKISCDEDRAETLLYNSAKLLSRAIDLKPMSLLAVGQLGNTYLLHGELKLKISRQLRALLTNRCRMSVNKQVKIYKEQDYEDASKDEIASALVDVCEECEELLVEAGRRYRLALSIDGNDMRALYNWGLALSFRAQLIADIGPEAAFDADKVFLAAIDKFDAIMSKSNDYTPDALFRWGLALQQRSQLRPRNSKEKVKLLQQAKRLYQDALDMDSNKLQVKEALSSCISELGFRGYY